MSRSNFGRMSACCTSLPFTSSGHRSGLCPRLRVLSPCDFTGPATKSPCRMPCFLTIPLGTYMSS